MPQKITLYRLFSKTGEFLYVGVTVGLSTRLGTHANSKPWWPQVDLSRTITEDFYDRASAEAAELLLIVTEAPRYNQAGKPGGNHERVGVNAATAAAVVAARRRRFARYVAEMREYPEDLVAALGGSNEDRVSLGR